MKFNRRLAGHVHVRMKTDRQTKEMEKDREKKRTEASFDSPFTGVTPYATRIE